MSACSLSMAAAAAIAASSLPSHPKISNLFFHTSPHPTTHFFPPKPILKPLTHKTQNHHPNSPIFSLIVSLPSPYRILAAAFDGFAVAAEDDSEVTEEKEEQEFDEEEEDDDDDDDDVDDYDNDDDDEDEEEKQKGSRSRDVGRLYIGNLPYSMTSTQLSEVFGEAGRVVSVEIVYDRVTDRSRGFGFVTMGSLEDAKEAIRMFDGAQVGGRTVKVNFPEVPKGGEREVMGPKIRNSYRGFVDTPHKIYAGNLGWNLTSEGLKDAFADQPGFLSAKVIYSRDSGKSRGFGFVSFASADEVESALKAMNGVEVEGRPLRLNLASERAPSASPPALERRNTVDSFESNEIPSIST